MELSFLKRDDFTVDVSSDNIQALKDYLTISFTDRVWDYRSKKFRFEVVDRAFYTDIDSNTINVMKPMSAILDKKFNLPLFRDSIFDLDGVEFNQKWVDIYSNHPKKDLGKTQIEITNKVKETNIGLISSATGSGKTELILGLLESYLESNYGNVLIITYANKVLDEIKLRADKYGIDHLNMERLKFINPVGYLRSKASKDPQNVKWISEVGLFIADEAHHFSKLDGKWVELLKKCNPDYMYGFTASADAVDGGILDVNTPDKTKSPQAMSVLSCCGEMIIHSTLSIPINILNVKTSIVGKEEYNDYVKDNPKAIATAVSLTLGNYRFPRLLRKVLDYHLPKGICFIPDITTLESGAFLATELNKLGIPTIFYSGSTIITPVGEVDSLDLKDLKELANGNHFRVLISNVVGVEGLDIPNINSIISLTGSKYKSIIQPLGRAARSDEVACVFIQDTYNRVLNKQMIRKREAIESSLVISSSTNTRINI